MIPRVTDAARLIAASHRPLDVTELSADKVVLAGSNTLIAIGEQSEVEAEPRLLGGDVAPTAKGPDDEPAMYAIGSLLDQVLSGIDAPAEVEAVADRASRRSGQPFASLDELIAALDGLEQVRSADPAAARHKRARARRLAAAIGALLAIAALAVLWQYERSQRKGADRAAAAAQGQQRASNRLLVAAMIGRAESLAEDGYYATAALFAASAIEVLDQYAASWPDRDQLRLDASSHLLRLSLQSSYALARDYSRDGAITDMDASTDGSIVAIAGGGVSIGVVRSGADRIDSFPGHKHTTERVAVSGDGEWMVSAADNGELITWRPRDRKLSRRLRASGSPVRDVAIHAAEGQAVAAVAAADGTVTLFDLTSGGESLLTTHQGGGGVVAVSATSSLVATSSAAGVIHLWDRTSRTQVGQLLGHSGPIRALDFADGTNRLASAGGDGTVRIWDPERRTLIATTIAGADVASLALSPDGGMVAVGSRDGTIRLWNSLDGRLDVALHGHGGATTAIDFVDSKTAGEHRLISASSSGQLRIWLHQAERGGARTISQAGEYGPALALGRGEIAVSDGERAVLRFDSESGAALPPLVGHASQVHQIAYSADGSLMATAAVDGDARLWRRDTAEPLMALTGHEGGIEDLAFSPDGTVLLTAGVDGSIRIWQAQSGEQQLMLRAHKGPVGAVAFDQSGENMVSAGWDGKIQLWKRVSRHRYKQQTTIEGNDRWFAVALSADGTRVAVGGEQGWRIYTADGQLLATIDDHDAVVADIELAGDLVATAGHDGSVRLWRRSDQQLLARLAADPAQVELSQDGSRLAWTHGRHLRITPIDLDILARSGAELLRAAEQRSGLIRRGFEIEYVSVR